MFCLHKETLYCLGPAAMAVHLAPSPCGRGKYKEIFFGSIYYGIGFWIYQNYDISGAKPGINQWPLNLGVQLWHEISPNHLLSCSFFDFGVNFCPCSSIL
jgi:hypothetical protein